MNGLHILVKTYLIIERASLDFKGEKNLRCRLHRSPVLSPTCMERALNNKCRESTRKELNLRATIKYEVDTIRKDHQS